MSLYRENIKMVSKLAIVAAGMFAFGYALIPIYKHICEMTGINILSLTERQVPGNGVAGQDAKTGNSQIDYSRTITVEFDANARGPWDFKPAQSSVQVHPGELATVMYKTAAWPHKPFPVMHPIRLPRTSISWNAFALTSTPWSLVKRKNGQLPL
jgi:cytochrome c oxidase assembly protein subunit 11